MVVARLRISVRVLLLGSIPLFFLGLVLIASFGAADAKDRLFFRLYDNHLVILADIMSAQRIIEQEALQDIQRYRTGWASAEGTAEAVQQQLNKAQEYWQAFSVARPALTDDSGDPVYDALDAAFSRAVTLYEEWISPAGADALLVRILNESTVSSEATMYLGGFGALSDDFIQNQITAAAIVRDEATLLTRRMLQTYLIGGSTLFILVAAVIWAVQRSLSQPLLRLRDLLVRVERTSDLNLRADESGHDEVSEAARALNTMMAHFQSLVKELKLSSDSLSKQAEQLHDISCEVDAGASRQASQVIQLATATEQMSNAVKNVAENASSAALVAQYAEQVSTSGREKAVLSVDATQTLTEQLTSANLAIGELQQGTNEISGVLDVIRKIAEQTNLLALNAAIEAARAGDAGRGFSVVADEVRALSANTQQATESIHAMIGQLQSRATIVTQSMQVAAHQAEASSTLVVQTDQMFEQIAQGVTEIAQLNIQISAATEQQQLVAESIAESIGALNGDIEQLTQGAGRSAQASNMLNKLAEQLTSGWKVFNVKY